ncbi:hypothetical protein DL766_010447 [Monosporascus sp. MC13-8B]|uniref:Uncharacterized protein n=1 Tax=Monosporascus cannonballus TaxID=155416 RepID=A0ABY0H2V0_9PEZI|nr:hypothetical protein DL762_007413 [Monosporascus cannonballus]RYO84226.1 hypothetical protein DL763_007550 [Monosporascus cannonballus]RYP01801.1 hypothetical protein DL766_010447 [Monosporascus sp. MC13-8B]
MSLSTSGIITVSSSIIPPAITLTETSREITYTYSPGPYPTAPTPGLPPGDNPTSIQISVGPSPPALPAARASSSADKTYLDRDCTTSTATDYWVSCAPSSCMTTSSEIITGCFVTATTTTTGFSAWPRALRIRSTTMAMMEPIRQTPEQSSPPPTGRVSSSREP